MIIFWIIVALYAAVGAIFLLRSGSRGIVADLLFAFLWPLFLWRHIRRGY